MNALKIYKPIILVALDNSETKNNVFNLLKSIGYKIYNLKFEEIKNFDRIIKTSEVIAKI